MELFFKKDTKYWFNPFVDELIEVKSKNTIYGGMQATHTDFFMRHPDLFGIDDIKQLQEILRLAILKNKLVQQSYGKFDDDQEKIFNNNIENIIPNIKTEPDYQTFIDRALDHLTYFKSTVDSIFAVEKILFDIGWVRVRRGVDTVSMQGENKPVAMTLKKFIDNSENVESSMKVVLEFYDKNKFGNVPNDHEMILRNQISSGYEMFKLGDPAGLRDARTFIRNRLHNLHLTESIKPFFKFLKEENALFYKDDQFKDDVIKFETKVEQALRDGDTLKILTPDENPNIKEKLWNINSKGFYNDKLKIWIIWDSDAGHHEQIMEYLQDFFSSYPEMGIDPDQQPVHALVDFIKFGWTRFHYRPYSRGNSGNIIIESKTKEEARQLIRQFNKLNVPIESAEIGPLYQSGFSRNLDDEDEEYALSKYEQELITLDTFDEIKKFLKQKN